jgi:hypothetical protein
MDIVEQLEDDNEQTNSDDEFITSVKRPMPLYF